MLSLVEKSIERLNDLQVAADVLTNEKIHRIEAVTMLRAEVVQAKLDALTSIAVLRAQHATELAEAEKKRLDSTRDVDTLAARTRDDRAAAAVTTLAVSARTDAEVLRALVATTAAANAAQLDQRLGSVNERISTLEKGAATGEGRAKFIDPAQADMKANIERLIALQSAGAGRSAGLQASWGILIGAVALAGGIVGLILKVIP